MKHIFKKRFIGVSIMLLVACVTFSLPTIKSHAATNSYTNNRNEALNPANRSTTDSYYLNCKVKTDLGVTTAERVWAIAKAGQAGCTTRVVIAYIPRQNVSGNVITNSNIPERIEASNYSQTSGVSTTFAHEFRPLNGNSYYYGSSYYARVLVQTCAGAFGCGPLVGVGVFQSTGTNNARSTFAPYPTKYDYQPQRVAFSFGWFITR